MVNLILEYSKYMMLLILILYTILNLYVLRSLDPKWQNRVCRKQIWLVFILQFLGYGIIYIMTRDEKMLIFYGIQMAVFLVYYLLFGLVYRHGSRVIISNTIMLVAIGLMVQTRLDFYYAKRQFIFVCAGFAMTLLIPVVIRYMHVLAKWAWFYGIFGILMLAVVWRMGRTDFGAQLAIKLGPVVLQPSEFIKISFVFFTASMLQKGQSFKQVAVTTVIAAAHVLVLVLSRDLGSALVFFISYLFMLLVATHQPLYMAAGLGSGSAAAVLAYKLFSHVRVRVKMWQNPFYDYNNASYQIAQSMFAISTGGWLGLGFYQGLPGSIPLARNDFVFAAISEELGIIFSACLVLTYLGFVLQMIWVSTWMNELFYKIVGFGMAVMFGFQVFLHIGGVTKLIPCTGITLPLISYGGSSVLSTMIVIGIIQGLHLMKEKEVQELEAKRRREEERRYEEERYYEQRRYEEERRREAERRAEARRRRNEQEAADDFEVIERRKQAPKRTRKQ